MLIDRIVRKIKNLYYYYPFPLNVHLEVEIVEQDLEDIRSFLPKEACSHLKLGKTYCYAHGLNMKIIAEQDGEVPVCDLGDYKEGFHMKVNYRLAKNGRISSVGEKFHAVGPQQLQNTAYLKYAYLSGLN